MKILYLLVARGGSKGVVDKNLQEVGGLSLIEPPPIPSNAANLTPWTKSNFLAVISSLPLPQQA